MKKLLICLLALSLVANLFAGARKTDWEEKGLKGKVKEWINVEYNIENKFGEDVKEIRDKHIYVYDDQGNIVYVGSYRKDGTLDKTYTYKYDNKGNRIESWSRLTGAKHIYKYDNNGNMIEDTGYIADAIYGKDIYKYDDNGNMIEHVSYHADGTSDKTYTCKYDNKGNKTESAIYKGFGSLHSRDINKYDDKGKVIESASFGEDGALTYKAAYKYDNDGNQTEIQVFSSNGCLTDKITCKYDAKGSRIGMESRSYKADGTSEGKDISKYDDNGNETETQSLNASGCLNYKTTCT